MINKHVFYLFSFFILSSFVSLAYSDTIQRPSTEGIKETTVLRYKLKSSQNCHELGEFKKNGKIFADKFQQKYIIDISNIGDFARFTFSRIEKDGRFGFYLPTDWNGDLSKSEPVFEFDENLKEAEKVSLRYDASLLRRYYNIGHGIELKQNTQFNTSFCETFDGYRNKDASGSWIAVGETLTSNRRSIVIEGNYRETCVPDSGPFTGGNPFIFSERGWLVFDVETGLLASSNIEIKVDGIDSKTDIKQVSSTSCQLNTVASNRQSISKESSERERKLGELKQLLEKGLIEKSTYDKKTFEILNTL